MWKQRAGIIGRMEIVKAVRQLELFPLHTLAFSLNRQDAKRAKKDPEIKCKLYSWRSLHLGGLTQNYR